MNEYDNSQTTVRRNLRRAKILLVEDNPDHQLLIRTILRTLMPEVELLTAATVEEALAQLAACSSLPSPFPRLILLDVYLPSCDDGWTLLRHLKEPTSVFRLIPVTLLSQSDKSADIQTAYQLGANSYIVKPVDLSQWQAYFESLQQYWLHTVTLPLLGQTQRS
ncbi:response regulator [Spirosoma pollinicola]|uniref:Response regulator n=1 Tax=Spirosoma pollinicola TaxID=2057025 RepID=A0A2K8YW18_9BACT|nr:response regulator [Spirosoma pollinicola]AUD01816.1 response regulator [Spirosoma pollinicola]